MSPQELSPFTPETHIAEAGRCFLGSQLAIIAEQEPPLRAAGDGLAVHETRKAIRRMRNAFQLLAPYYETDFFRPYNKGLRKTMRRLGPARDLAVFLQKLAAYGAAMGERGETAGPEALESFWRAQLVRAEEEAREAAGKGRYRELLAALREVVRSEGMGVLPGEEGTARKVRHVAPLLILERLAAVRAFDELLPGATPTELHRLRIRFKRLRYTLDLFAPVLGEGGLTLIEELNAIQDHLGELNDATVALELLAQTPAGEGREAGIAAYRAALNAELDYLRQSFRPVWEAFDGRTWREALYRALAHL